MENQPYYAETSRNETQTIGATAVKILGQNATRRMLVLSNTSAAAQVITIALSNTTPAVAGEGIILGAGVAFSDSNNAEYKIWRGDIYAVASAAGATLAITEL